jgi:hypothetical protein
MEFLSIKLISAALNRVKLQVKMPRGGACRIYRSLSTKGDYEDVGLAVKQVYEDTADLTPGSICRYLAVAISSPWLCPDPSDFIKGKPLKVKIPESLHTKTFTAVRKRQAFSIQLGGRLDESNTVTRQPEVYCPGHGHRNPPWDKVFEPNLYVAIENTGKRDVINPWLVVNGRRDWWSAETMAREIEKLAGHKAAQSEKAMALWQFGIDEIYDQRAGMGWVDGIGDPVKLFNIYGFDGCIPQAIAGRRLAEALGLKAREVWLGALALLGGYGQGRCCDHDILEIWADGAWHLLDTDLMLCFLKRDNRTVASAEDICRDGDLLRRTHRNLGLCGRDLPGKIYYFEDFRRRRLIYPGRKSAPQLDAAGNHINTADSYPPPHTMAFRLRPREKMVRYWGNVGKIVLSSPQLHPEVRFSNGKLIYRPDLRDKIALKGVEESRNVRQEESKDVPALHPFRAGRGCEIIWKIASPYAIAGARVGIDCRRTQPDAGLQVFMSKDGRNWREVWTMPGFISGENCGPASHADTSIELDRLLNPVYEASRQNTQILSSSPCYCYFIKVAMWAGSIPESVGIESMRFDTDLQCATRSLPSLFCGNNIISYRDQTPGSRQVRITYGWQENHEIIPPEAPQLLHPAPKTDVGKLDFEFRWKKPAGGSSGIDDYHIQVSRYADFRWCVCPTFDRYISRTKYAGGTAWQPEFGNLLNHGETYYWRLRARNSQGAWGPWSEPADFTPGGPGIVLNLSILRKGNSRILKWLPNPNGTRAAGYKVYASDDSSGFSPNAKNLIATVERPEFAIRNARKGTSYRVAAVDVNNVQGTPSEFVQLT